MFLNAQFCRVAAFLGQPPVYRFHLFLDRKVTMVVCYLSIEAKFVGPFSVGTVSIIKLVREHFGLGLKEAKTLIDQAVEGQRACIPAQSLTHAEAFLKEVQSLPNAHRMKVSIEES